MQALRFVKIRDIMSRLNTVTATLIVRGGDDRANVGNSEKLIRETALMGAP